MSQVHVMSQPAFAHDCSRCAFLGHIECPELGACDLYYCPQDSFGPTVITRFGPDGEYSSGLPFIDRRRALAIAAHLAVEKGLLAADARINGRRSPTVREALAAWEIEIHTVTG